MPVHSKYIYTFPFPISCRSTMMVRHINGITMIIWISSVYLAQESKEKQDISVYHLLVLKHIFAFNVD